MAFALLLLLWFPRLAFTESQIISATPSLISIRISLSATNTYTAINTFLPTIASGQIDPEYALIGFDECVKRGFSIERIKDGFSDMIDMIGRDEMQVTMHIPKCSLQSEI